MNTKEIYEELKKSVVGQDEYLKKLSSMAYKHILKQNLIKKELAPINTNMLIIGPSGCGKTFAAKKLAKIIDVPFYEINCSNIVQVGYKGNNSIEDCLADMVSKFRGKYDGAIVYLDEFDKVFDQCLFVDGRGLGCQQNFLKIMEPNETSICLSDRHSSRMTIDTSGLTFLATGSFNNIKDSKRKNASHNMGFNSLVYDENDIKLSQKDLVEFGYMAELVGRFSEIVNINQLNEDVFYEVLKKSNDSVISKYEKLFKEDNVMLEVSDSLLKKVARDSYSTSTGLRNLDTSFSSIMDKCVYDVGSDDTIVGIKVGYKNNDYYFDYSYGENRYVNFVRKNVPIDLEELKEHMKLIVEDYDLPFSEYADIRKEINGMFVLYEGTIMLQDVFRILDTKITGLKKCNTRVDAMIKQACTKTYEYYKEKMEDVENGK